MKKLLAVVLMFPLLLHAQKKSPVKRPLKPSFVIRGKVVGLKEKEKISLVSLNRPTDTVAKAVVLKGTFVLKGSVDAPDLYQINYHRSKKKSMLFLDNSNIQITGNVKLLQNIVVKGSPSHDDFLSFQGLFNPLFEKLGQLNKSLAAQASVGNNDSLVKSAKLLMGEIEIKVDSFVNAKKDAVIAPFTILVTAELSQNVGTLQKRFSTISEKQQQSFYGEIIKNQIEEATFAAIGTPAIEFSQNDTSGVSVSLSSFKGKYVLVDFWASWCKPCRQENPNVVRAFEKFKSKNFTVLGVSLDRSKTDWLNAIATDGLQWTQVSDLKYWNNEAAAKYRIQSIPQNILVDPNGIIVGKNLRGEELEMKLCELLGCGQ